MTLRRLSRGILIGLITVLCAPVSGAVRQVVSVLVVAPTGTQIRHSGTATLVGVGAGAEFLPGDAIRTAGESPVLLACTGSDDAARDLTFELPTNSLVVFGSSVPTEARNQQRTDTPCTLPFDDRALQATMDDARLRANLNI